MKKVVIGGVLAIAALLVYAFVTPNNAANTQTGNQEEGALTWYTWEEAIKMSQKSPKKIFIDVYTDWCGWCKKMDKSTFSDPDVAAYLAKNFIPVKFNAEQKESIKYKDHELKYLPQYGRNGVHELAVSLLDGQLGYPAFVYLDENQDRISISPGYKEAPYMLKELKFVAEGHYKNSTFQQYLQKNGK